MTLTYLAEITPKPEFFDAAEAAVRDVIPATLAEEGCLAFTFYADDKREKLFIVETWADMAAFEFHHAQPYIKEVFAQYEGWLTKMPVLTEINEVKAA